MAEDLQDVKPLVDEYKEAISKLGLESALVDYLTSLAANAFTQVKTLSSFTKVKIDISIY